MSHKVIIESIATVSNGKISGRALVPGISRNGNQYTPDQMESARNLNTPLKLDWEHSDEVIGSVTFSYDKNLQEMHYSGVVTSQNRLNEMKNGSYQVSIEAGVEEVLQSCTPKKCYNMLIGLTMEGLGITNNPGVTATTLQITESKQDWDIIDSKCEKCVKESETPKEDLSKKVADLEKTIHDLTTCKTCGKHKSI